MAGNKVGNRYDLMALALTVGAAETASGKRGERGRGDALLSGQWW